MKKTLLIISLTVSSALALAPNRATNAAQEPQKPAAGSQPSAVQPQQPSAVEHFSKDGLSFDYPAGWKLVDRSTDAAQHLIVGRDGSSALIMVIAHRDPVTDIRQFIAARDAITWPYVETLARRFGVQKMPSWDEAQCLDIGERLPLGERFATGFKLSGQSDGLPSTGEVYAISLGRRFVNLVYVRNDKDDSEGTAAWRRVLDTLKVDAPPGTEGTRGIISGGVLNGKAVKKPQPYYPPGAKAARQQGTVTVQIVVDEEGNVISAKAVTGPPLLRGAGEDAAKNAKFTPTRICGHPVKVSGVITYNFVLVGPFIRP